LVVVDRYKNLLLEKKCVCEKEWIFYPLFFLSKNIKKMLDKGLII
jgi:hypothetical protein